MRILEVPAGTSTRKVDDLSFFEVPENIRVFLEDEKLEIIELIPQKDISIYNQRRVILDVYCKLSSGKIVNVEVENDAHGEKHDHQRRVRHYGLMIDAKALSPNDDFSKLPDLYMIYLTLRDFIGEHKTVYHVERQVIETKSYLDNGYHEIYINAEVDDKSSIAEIMKVLSTTDYVNRNFKTIAKVKLVYHYKTYRIIGISPNFLQEIENSAIIIFYENKYFKKSAYKCVNIRHIYKYVFVYNLF